MLERANQVSAAPGPGELLARGKVRRGIGHQHLAAAEHVFQVLDPPELIPVLRILSARLGHAADAS